MGTKNDPGKFDCYGAAEPDEPMFVLLGRDRLAPSLVDEWADLAEGGLAHSSEKIAEARQCAAAMRAWRGEKRGYVIRLTFLDVERDGDQLSSQSLYHRSYKGEAVDVLIKECGTLANHLAATPVITWVMVEVLDSADNSLLACRLLTNQ